MNKESIEEERYDLLDHWLMWYGGFNATLIGKILGMTRQNVSILIRNYRNSRPPETLEYDASKKMHVVGKGFVPKNNMRKSHLFLDHLRGQELITMYRGMDWWDPEKKFSSKTSIGTDVPNRIVVSSPLFFKEYTKGK